MNIKRAHDRFFRSFFADPAHLQGLLKEALPVDVAATLDLQTVKLEPGTWIDQNNRDHLSDHTDYPNPGLSRAALWLMRSIRRKTDDTLRELQAVLEGAEHLLSDEEYQAFSRYLLETKELSIEELNAKIEALMHQGRIREGLLTTAEQLMQKGFEAGQERGLREGEELGRRKGEQDGRYQERREMARQMLADGEAVEKILRYTHLTRDELQELESDAP